MEDYKKLLTDLYTIYDPERIKQIDYFLNKYKGKEQQFYTRQKENYENKKPISDSQKIIDEALARIKSREKEAAKKEEKPVDAPAPPPEKIRSKSTEEESKAAVPPPLPTQEAVPKPPVSKPPTDTPFVSETKSRTAAEIREERSAQKPFAEHAQSEKKQSVSPRVNMPEQEISPKKSNEEQRFETTPPIKTDVRVKRRYFFNIFGMVLLTIVLIVIIYFTFFVETDNKAKGIVQKPAGMRTETPAKIQSDKSTIDDKEAANKTKEIAPKELKTEVPSEETAKPDAETKKTSDKTISKTPEKETKASFWTWLFTKKEVKEEPKIVEQESPPQQVENNKTTKTKTSFWDRLFAKKEEPKTNNTKAKPVEKKQTIALSESVEDTEPIETETKPAQTTEKQIVEEQPPAEKTIEEKAEIKEETKEQAVLTTNSNSGSALRLTKDDIQFPAYFVACYAVKTEDYALVKINQLKKKGFDACYYWIPDLVPYGNPYFKVVIGPFSSSREAYRKLTPVQEHAEFDAYVITLK